MSEIDVLESVLSKTAAIVDGVADDQLALPTPCTEFDVAGLRNHIVGWSQVFAAGSAETAYEGDPFSFEAGGDPAAEFRASAAAIVQGWRDNGFDRQVSLVGGGSPGELVFNMTLMEYLQHGWDLATATGQPIPYTDAEADAALARAEQTLKDEYRGDAFGPRVEVAADAPAVDRFVAFMGRRP